MIANGKQKTISVEKEAKNKQSSIETHKRYETSQAIFEMCKAEYENEKERTNTIDTKIYIATALASGLLLLILETTNVESLFADISSLIKIMTCSMFVASLVSVCSSLVLLTLTIFTRNYVSLFPDSFLTVEVLSEEKELVEIAIANKYYECCLKNRDVNNKRCKKYNIAVASILLTIVFFLVFFILKLF